MTVADRTRMMRQQLELALSTFLAQVDADMLKIPRSMRGMTLGELDACWAGSFVATSRAIAQKQFAEQHPERDQAETLELAKRKRESPLESPRNSKNRESPRDRSCEDLGMKADIQRAPRRPP